MMSPDLRRALTEAATRRARTPHHPPPPCGPECARLQRVLATVRAEIQELQKLLAPPTHPEEEPR